ncbi:hypothetical protein QTP86_008051 [Hemibagrus guttatus]|nr:hypothetical protein QTP86_008051 [Hemibagrus guttatus]
MVIDFRRAQSDHSPLNIDGYNVELIKSTKFLDVHLAEDLTWSLNTSSITKKAQQRLYFLRRLRKAYLPPPILTTFYRGTIESILSSCITAWFENCTVLDHKTLQQIVRTAEKIIGVSLPSITDIYSTRCICKANSIHLWSWRNFVSFHHVSARTDCPAGCGQLDKDMEISHRHHVTLPKFYRFTNLLQDATTDLLSWSKA